MTVGTLISRLRKLEEQHRGEEGPIVLVSHRAIYSEAEIPTGATLYPTEQEAIEAFYQKLPGSRPAIGIGVADFHRDAGEPIGWITEATADPDRAAVVIHDDIRRTR